MFLGIFFVVLGLVFDLHPCLWSLEMRGLPHHLFIDKRTHVM